MKAILSFFLFAILSLVSPMPSELANNSAAPFTANDEVAQAIGICSFDIRLYEDCLNGSWRKYATLDSITDGSGNSHRQLRNGLSFTQHLYPEDVTVIYPASAYNNGRGDYLRLSLDHNTNGLHFEAGACRWHEYEQKACGSCQQDEWMPSSPGHCDNSMKWVVDHNVHCQFRCSTPV